MVPRIAQLCSDRILKQIIIQRTSQGTQQLPKDSKLKDLVYLDIFGSLGPNKGPKDQHWYQFFKIPQKLC